MIGKMRYPLRRNACCALASVVDPLFPCPDPRDAPTVRLPWRRSVRRRRLPHGPKEREPGPMSRPGSRGFVDRRLQARSAEISDAEYSSAYVAVA